MASAPTLLPARSWPDLVFHVLAHVAGTGHLPASLYDPVYVDHAAQHLGPAAERPLGEDAATLAQVLPSHEQLARAQLLAWLFDDVGQAALSADRELAALVPDEVARPGLLAALQAAGPAVEVLRCAALLEQEAHGQLPAPVLQPEVLLAALAEVAGVAPRLAACDLLPVRALRLRGRLFGTEIWVGVPAPEPLLDVAHVAWQAAHEATVGEVKQMALETGSGLAERQVEAVALVVLAERAAASAQARSHRHWLGHFGEPGPNVARSGLSQVEQDVLTACLEPA